MALFTEFEDYTGATAESLTQAFGDTNPDALSSVYSGPGTFSVPSFGPGYVADAMTGFEYTGEGDRVWWGPYDYPSTTGTPSTAGTVAGGTEVAGQQWDTELARQQQLPPVDIDRALPSDTGFEGSIRAQTEVAPGTDATGTSSVKAPLTEPNLSLGSSVHTAQTGRSMGMPDADAVPGGSIELQPLGARASAPSDVVATESVYSGDSYHGLYSEDGGAASTIDYSASYSVEAPVGGDAGADFGATPGEMQMADLYTEPSFVDTVPSGTRGGIQPFEAGDASTAPALLDDLETVDLGSQMDAWEIGLPEVPPSFGDLDLGSLGEAPLRALGDFAGDPANFSFGAGGAGMGMGKWMGFFKQRGIDLAVGGALMPLFNYLDDTTDTPWVSRTIQGRLASLGLVIGNDPFGVVAAPIAWGIQEYIRQRQRLI